MKAYYFRWPGNDWVGLAVAPTMTGIFCVIDEFGDPTGVELKKAKKGGFCVNRKDDEESEFEYCGETPFPDEKGWKTYNWKEDK